MYRNQDVSIKQPATAVNIVLEINTQRLTNENFPLFALDVVIKLPKTSFSYNRQFNNEVQHLGEQKRHTL